MVEMLHPSVCLICVHCSNCSENLSPMLEKSKTFPGEKFTCPNFPFTSPRDLSVPNRRERLVSERRPHATLAVCKHCAISQKASATRRRGSGNSGRLGQLDAGAIQPARLGDSPLAAGQDTAVATPEPQKCLRHQASNDRIKQDGTFEARRV